MIKYVRGNILDDKSIFLVCPVNCVGVMGKGLALQFKMKFPDLFNQYNDACLRGEYKPGSVRIHAGSLNPTKSDKLIACVATKDHWKNPSILSWVDSCLSTLRLTLDMDCFSYTDRSVAIPPLGCGCGGLRWSNVKPLIEKHFADYSGEVTVYEQ